MSLASDIAELAQVESALTAAYQGQQVTLGDKTYIAPNLKALQARKDELVNRIALATGQGGFPRSNMGIIKR